MSFDSVNQKLSDVIEIIGGGTPKRDTPAYWGGDIPWLSVVDFNSNNRFIRDSIEKITELGLEKSSTKLLEKGQIIISARGTVGCLGQVTREMAFNQSCYGLSGKKDILENDFLYYLMCLKVTELRQKTHGAVFDTITRETFNHIDVVLPSLVVQKKISKILGDIDKKIELNNQTNQTLEAMAQAIFKSWFVDFEPVNAKIAVLKEGGGQAEAELAAMMAISGKTAEQLSIMRTTQPEAYQQLTQTADLFPAAMQDSELGEIPEGWKASTIEKNFRVIMGQSPDGDTYNQTGTGMVFYQGRRDFGFRYPSPRIYTTSPKRVAQAGDTLISVRAPVGDKNMAIEQCCLGRGVASIRHNTGSLSFTYAFISHIESTLSNMGSDGTVFASINKDELNSVPFVAPSGELINHFENQICAFDKKIEVLSKQTISLINFRDSLLPKLLSGEIDLSEMHEVA